MIIWSKVGPHPNPAPIVFFLTGLAFSFTQFMEFGISCLFNCFSLIFPSIKSVLFTVVFTKPRTAVPAVDRMNVGSVGMKRGPLVLDSSFCF